MAENDIQTSYIQVFGPEEGETGGRIPFPWEAWIPSVSEKPIKCLGNFFNTTLRDKAAVL